MKEKVLELMKRNSFCVLSSVNMKVQPESSLVGFSENEKFEIVFECSNLSRKYQNILKNPHIALVVSEPENKLTVQYEGIAREFSPAKEKQLISQFLEKRPFARKFLDREDIKWFHVKPKWMRYSDYNKKPVVIEEMRQFS
jgi:general stress protein 26